MGSPGKIIRQLTDDEIEALNKMQLDTKKIGKNIQSLYFNEKTFL